MAINKETPTWVEGIYQLEESDSPYGGVGGTTNIQFVQLACRTSYLFELLKNLFAASVSGRSIGTFRVEKTIPADTDVKLPIKYIVGSRALMLFSDATGEIGPKYYSELGVIGGESEYVRFTFDVPAGAVITAIALATTVDHVVYEGIYNYKFAWSDVHRLYGNAAALIRRMYLQYTTASKYSAEITDNLDISRVVDEADKHIVTDNTSEQVSTVKLAAVFNDFKGANEDFEMTIKRDGERIREDVAFIEYMPEVSDVWNSYINMFVYDTPYTPDEDLVLDVARDGVTERVLELADTHNTIIQDNMRTIANHNVDVDDEFTGEMDGMRMREYATANFTDICNGALEKSLVLNITAISSGDSIYLKDIYGGADDSDLVVIASKN